MPDMSQRLSISSASELTGVFPALFTPLKDDDRKRLNNSIDYEKAKVIIDDLIAAGVSGLVPVGTTGQSPTVSHAQHLDFIRFTAEYVEKRVPIIAGAGSNCTRESVEMIQKIGKSVGDVAVLCVTGYYNNPPQEGVKLHYETLAAETGAKIVVYNVPSRTNSYVEPETLIALSALPGIIGVKQAVDFRAEGKHREDTRRVLQSVDKSQFAVVSGEDDLLYALLELGGTGVITASGNIPEVARLYLRMIKAWTDGESKSAAALQEEVSEFARLVFMRKNPIPLGTFFNSPLYLPLVSVRETADGEKAEEEILAFIKSRAISLVKYHNRE